jgi:hypothetical protein
LNLNNEIYLRIKQDAQTCEKIREFIEENKYPLISKLDSSNIKRLQNDQKTMIMTAINQKNSIHMNLVESLIPQISAKHRELVFTYIDSEKDSHLVAYFKINTNNLPQTIIYNFQEKFYHVDTSESSEVLKSEESYKNHLETLISKMQSNNLAWSTGNWLEDLLLKFGIKFTGRAIMWIYGGCFALIVVFMMIVIFYCGEKPDDDLQSSNQMNSNEKSIEPEDSRKQNLQEKKDQ